MKVWHDCESVGLCGSVKLHQFAVDDGPVQMIPVYRGWQNDAPTRAAIGRLLGLIDREDTLYIGFNAAFDLFHALRMRHEMLGEPADSPCRPVMPFKCKVLDLQFAAMQRSKLAPFAYSRGANRSVALLRRIPRKAQDVVAARVFQELRPLIPATFGLKMGEHEVKGRPDLVTLTWYTTGSLSLKGLMREYGFPTLAIEDVWPLPEKDAEKPWLPYPDPAVHGPVEAQCEAVMRNPDAPFWTYAKLDILYLKALYEILGRPEPDHHDTCAHTVAYTRYYGFDLDHQALNTTIGYYQHRIAQIERNLQGINLRSSTDRLALLKPHFPLIASTRKSVLKSLANEPGPGGELARQILDYGPMQQRLNQCLKIRESRTGRAHPDFRVMGTATGRMAGTGKMNWQGVGAVEMVDPELLEPGEFMVAEAEQNLGEGEDVGDARALNQAEAKEKVGLRHCMLVEAVGDWSSFEVCLASRIYNDDQLIKDLAEGIDVHSMATATAHPMALLEKLSYPEIRARYKAHDPLVTRWRKEMKAIVFGIFYFASAQKVASTLGVSITEGERVLDLFYTRYPAIRRYRQEIERRFITADVKRWSAGSVRRMAREQTDLLGFTRRWDFEAEVAQIMWGLGKSGVRTGLAGSIVRTQEKGPQTIDMAVTSAFYGSAIALQAAVSRQAGNMPVQSTGANMTKQLGALLWDRHRVPWMNVHDELAYARHSHFSTKIFDTQQEYVERYRELVPSLAFDCARAERWSDK